MHNIIEIAIRLISDIGLIFIILIFYGEIQIVRLWLCLVGDLSQNVTVGSCWHPVFWTQISPQILKTDEVWLVK